MERRIILPFLAFTLFLPSALAETQANQPARSALTASPQGIPEATGGAHPGEDDTLVVPDGTPLRISVVNGFSSESARVGDTIDFSVMFEVRADGVVVIPQRTTFTGKVMSVDRPRRGDRGGNVKIAFEKLSLPTGEITTVRSVSKPPNRGKQVAEASAMAPGLAATLFITAGIPLLALPFEKGEEQVVQPGTIEVVYLNGPLSVSRKAAMAVQPDPASGFAEVYVSPAIAVRRGRETPTVFCGNTPLSIYYGAPLRLEMHPGSYWFSTNNRKERPIKITVLASHEYLVGRDRHGLHARERQYKSGLIYASRFVDEDLTGLTPEEYRSLTAEPAITDNASPGRNP
jgi:hypothetical protein